MKNSERDALVITPRMVNTIKLLFLIFLWFSFSFCESNYTFGKPFFIFQTNVRLKYRMFLKNVYTIWLERTFFINTHFIRIVKWNNDNERFRFTNAMNEKISIHYERKEQFGFLPVSFHLRNLLMNTVFPNIPYKHFKQFHLHQTYH